MKGYKGQFINVHADSCAPVGWNPEEPIPLILTIGIHAPFLVLSRILLLYNITTYWWLINGYTRIRFQRCNSEFPTAGWSNGVVQLPSQAGWEIYGDMDWT